MDTTDHYGLLSKPQAPHVYEHFGVENRLIAGHLVQPAPHPRLPPAQRPAPPSQRHHRQQQHMLVPSQLPPACDLLAQLEQDGLDNFGPFQVLAPNARWPVSRKSRNSSSSPPGHANRRAGASASGPRTPPAPWSPARALHELDQSLPAQVHDSYQDSLPDSVPESAPAPAPRPPSPRPPTPATVPVAPVAPSLPQPPSAPSSAPVPAAKRPPRPPAQRRHVCMTCSKKFQRPCQLVTVLSNRQRHMRICRKPKKSNSPRVSAQSPAQPTTSGSSSGIVFVGTTTEEPAQVQSPPRAGGSGGTSLDLEQPETVEAGLAAAPASSVATSMNGVVPSQAGFAIAHDEPRSLHDERGQSCVSTESVDRDRSRASSYEGAVRAASVSYHTADDASSSCDPVGSGYESVPTPGGYAQYAGPSPGCQQPSLIPDMDYFSYAHSPSHTQATPTATYNPSPIASYGPAMAATGMVTQGSHPYESTAQVAQSYMPEHFTPEAQHPTLAPEVKLERADAREVWARAPAQASATRSHSVAEYGWSSSSRRYHPYPSGAGVTSSGSTSAEMSSGGWCLRQPPQPRMYPHPSNGYPTQHEPFAMEHPNDGYASSVGYITHPSYPVTERLDCSDGKVSQQPYSHYSWTGSELQWNAQPDYHGPGQ